jgi:hypothetical protein
VSTARLFNVILTEQEFSKIGESLTSGQEYLACKAIGQAKLPLICLARSADFVRSSNLFLYNFVNTVLDRAYMSEILCIGQEELVSCSF